MISVYVTCRDSKEAEKVSRHLLGKRLVACSNMFPVRSMYWWKGSIAEETETAVILKSVEGNFKMIVDEVRKVHSYEVPAIIKHNVDANDDYDEWCRNEITDTSSRID